MYFFFASVYATLCITSVLMDRPKEVGWFFSVMMALMVIAGEIKKLRETSKRASYDFDKGHWA